MDERYISEDKRYILVDRRYILVNEYYILVQKRYNSVGILPTNASYEDIPLASLFAVLLNYY